MKIISLSISGLLLAAGLYILIFGPRPDQAIPPDRQGDTIVEYWEKWVGSESAAMQQIVDDFNNSVGKEKHIYVQYVSTSDVQYKTLLAIAGGDPPDVAGLWHDVVVQYGALGALQPLETMAAAHGITADYYKPVYWNACHYNGHLYALVSTPGAVALFYNKKIFQESAPALRKAGLDPDRPPQTLDELDRYADALNVFSTDSNGRRHLERAGYIPMEPGWYITETQLWFGTDVWDNATGHFILNDPRVVRAYDWVQSYSKKIGGDEIREFVGQNDPTKGGFATAQNAFIAGRVAMEQQGPWMANFIHNLNPAMDGNWAAAPFPSAVPGQKDVTFCPFDALMIPKGAKHPAEAFEFIAYVNRQDVMEKLCSLHCKNSPLAKVSENFLNHHRNPFIRVFEELASSPNAYGPIQSAIGQEVGKDLQALAQGLAALTIDPNTGQPISAAAALDRLQEREEEKLALYRNEQARRAGGQNEP
ncbi:MAG: extracellular solute-binding protein [Tepidisphaeraceae bacterium]